MRYWARALLLGLALISIALGLRVLVIREENRALHQQVAELRRGVQETEARAQAAAALAEQRKKKLLILHQEWDLLRRQVAAGEVPEHVHRRIRSGAPDLVDALVEREDAVANWSE